MSGNFPPGVTGYEPEIAGEPEGRYAIDQWIGTGEPWTGRGSWQPVNDTYDAPFRLRADADAEIERMVREDLDRAWQRFSGDEMDAEPDPTDFHYRVVDVA